MTKHLTIDLDITDLDLASANIEKAIENVKAFKNHINSYYEETLTNRTLCSKIVNTLAQLFTANKDEPIKKSILHSSYLRERYLYNHRLPYETYLCLASLTYPFIFELWDIISDFEDYFTPAMVLVKVKTEFSSVKAKKEAVYKGLALFRRLTIVKTLNKGLLKVVRLPSIDVNGLEAILLTEQFFSDNADVAGKHLRIFSFEITHGFVNAHPNIRFENIVPNDIWHEFMNSDADFSLQLDNDGKFAVSNNQYIYKDGNTTMNGDVTKDYFDGCIVTIQDMLEARDKDAKMRKIDI